MIFNYSQTHPAVVVVGRVDTAMELDDSPPNLQNLLFLKRRGEWVHLHGRQQAQMIKQKVMIQMVFATRVVADKNSLAGSSWAATDQAGGGWGDSGGWGSTDGGWGASIDAGWGSTEQSGGGWGASNTPPWGEQSARNEAPLELKIDQGQATGEAAISTATDTTRLPEPGAEFSNIALSAAGWITSNAGISAHENTVGAKERDGDIPHGKQTSDGVLRRSTQKPVSSKRVLLIVVQILTSRLVLGSP